MSSLLIASFDFDGTLVKPKFSKFPKNKDDWKFYPPISSIIKKFAELTQQNATIILRSDQTKPFKQQMIDDVIQYIREQVQQQYQIECNPIYQMISWNKATHKPDTTLYQDKFKGVNIHPSSFHVGDAAGRQGDWSNVDQEFAQNCQLQFFTPEEYFG